MVLGDFAAVDHELADVHAVFQNLADIQGIEDWSFGEATWSEDQKAFERQWRRLPAMYEQLNHALREDGMATRAHLTRRVAEGEGRLDVDHVLAAGLATMSRAEWMCLQQWDKVRALKVLWDADAAYVDDVHNEAGLFVRKHRGMASAFPRVHLATHPPEVHSVACSSTVSQTQYVRDILSDLTPEELDRTLVVLPDGSSLGTLLQALPRQPRGINVTMGVALHETPVVSFVEHLFVMLETEGSGWRLEHVQALHAHPVMLHVTGPGDARHRAGKAIHKLAKAHRAWVKSGDFLAHHAEAWSKDLAQLDALKTDDASAFLHALGNWALALEQRMEALPPTLKLEGDEAQDDPSDPDREVPWIPAGWRRFRTVLAVLKRLQDAHAPMAHAREVRVMARRLLRQERVDLLGEPNQGLQIMGLTETRALDFDRVLMLDMNEGIVPQTSMPDSFLPLDLRHALNMPGPREREARYAYLVHRLMNRAKEVHLLHRGASDKKDGGEPSRYLMQLEGSFHKPDGTPYLEVNHVVHQLPLPDARPDIPELEVSEGMRRRLGQWSSEGMSPSAINTLLQCPRNFAYRYLYRMGEATELQTAMEASTLGSVVHWVMEHGLAEAEGHVLQTHHLDKVRKGLDGLLEQALESEYNAALVKRGENVLQLEIARTTSKLLRQEMKNCRADRRRTLSSSNRNYPPTLPREPWDSVGLPTAGRKVWRPSGGGLQIRQSRSQGAQAQGAWTEQLEGGDKGKALQLVVYAGCWRRWGPEHGVCSHPIGAQHAKGLLMLESMASTSSSPPRPNLHRLARQIGRCGQGIGLCTTPTPNTANIVSSWTRRSFSF